MHTKKELDERFLAAGVRPLKSLGQNFLVNPKVCEVITGAVENFKPQSVVEIGPGLGALTDELAKASVEKKFALSLVELDSGLIEYWKGRNFPGVLIHADALKTDWAKLELPRPSVLVSNLPYSIAASLVVEVSSVATPPFDVLILMFQKEVALRITAKPGDEDYGMLSVMAQSRWRISRLIDAGPQDFFPVPNVGSRVLVFAEPDGGGAVGNPEEFLKFVKTAFAQRRKKLLSNLSVRYPKETVASALKELGFQDAVRAQELAPDEWQKLFTLLNHGTSHEKGRLS